MLLDRIYVTHDQTDFLLFLLYVYVNNHVNKFLQYSLRAMMRINLQSKYRNCFYVHIISNHRKYNNEFFNQENIKLK